MDGADLTDARLVGANLTRASTKSRESPGGRPANFTDAHLDGADLTDARLNRANFTDADLVRAVLTRARPAGATFTNAILIDANLTGAGLTDANFTDAILVGAIRQARATEGPVPHMPATSSATRDGFSARVRSSAGCSSLSSGVTRGIEGLLCSDHGCGALPPCHRSGVLFPLDRGLRRAVPLPRSPQRMRHGPPPPH
nr:pentapeptide repeat-containing protein [Streptomyces sp. AC550_RSS872]